MEKYSCGYRVKTPASVGYKRKRYENKRIGKHTSLLQAADLWLGLNYFEKNNRNE